MDQNWKQILNYPDYEVSEDGQIRSNKGRSVRILKQKINKNGYHSVRLHNWQSKSPMQRVHRLVAIAFIPNPKNKPFVNHTDGDTHNNVSDNLEWMTHAENIENARDRGKWDHMYGNKYHELRKNIQHA